MLFIQQGDVLIKSVSEIKGTKVRPDSRGFVLAEGEHTGHYHGITLTDNVELYKTDKKELYLKVLKEPELAHQEHGNIVLPVGDYEISYVKTIDHVTREIEIVKD